MTGYLFALGVTLIVEASIVAAIYSGQRLRMACACVVATSGTHLVMHYWLPLHVTSATQWLLVGEIGALLIEAAIYASVSRPRGLGRALVASALANASSYAIGILASATLLQ